MRYLIGAAAAAAMSLGAFAGPMAQELTVGVSWSNFQEERWKTDEAAIVAALEEAGVKYISADAQSSSAKQVSDVESLIASGADALIILAQDAAAIAPAVEAAAARAGVSRAAIIGAENGEIAEARRAALDSVHAPFTSLSFPEDQKLSTRLGLQDLRVPLDPPREGPFGAEITALTIPGHMVQVRDRETEAEAKVPQEGDSLRVALDGKTFGYGRMGLSKTRTAL